MSQLCQSRPSHSASVPVNVRYDPIATKSQTCRERREGPGAEVAPARKHGTETMKYRVAGSLTQRQLRSHIRKHLLYFPVDLVAAGKGSESSQRLMTEKAGEIGRRELRHVDDFERPQVWSGGDWLQAC